VKRHYALVVKAIRALDKEIPAPEDIPGAEYAPLGERDESALRGYRESGNGSAQPPPKEQPVAIVFVGGYGGLGRHALYSLLRMFPGHFKGVVFVSIAVVDSDVFKGAEEIAALESRTRENLALYERFARSLGLAAASDFAVGTEVAVEAERLGSELFKSYPKALVVAGQLIFAEDTLWTRVLHNETAFLIQRRLQHAGVPMIVLPIQLNLKLDAPRRSIGASTAPYDAPLKRA
jgi:hypothetical protein